MNQPIDVALFVTCLTDQFYPRVAIAVTKILEHYGCGVHCPQSQTCCGQPFFNNGFHPEAGALARKWVVDFERYPYVVTPSASCCAMVRQHFPELLRDDAAWAPSLARIGARTFEFVEFLTRVLNVNLNGLSLPERQSLTYHYTCHHRSLGTADESLGLLRQLGNVDLREMEKQDQCCGFGGTFAVKYPDISRAIVEDKVACISATGASTTVCNDAGCTMNIAGMCQRAGVTVQTRHIAEVIAESMGLEVDKW